MQYQDFGPVLRKTPNLMKRLLSLLFLLPLVLGGCDDDESRTETWTVASEKGVAGVFWGLGHVPAYIVKTSANADWEISSAHINGFTFEKGYEYVLRVRIEPFTERVCDGPTHIYTLEKLISRTPAQPPVDPKSFCPEFDITIASERGDNQMTAYWFKDMRYPDPRWQAFPWEIEGFDFRPGFESRLRIQPVAEYDPAHEHLNDSDSWTVKYYLKVLISSDKKDSEGLPGK